MDPPQAVEAVGVGLGVARGKYRATALRQIAAAGNWKQRTEYRFLNIFYELHT